jgi:alkanesulfonate monooxygenase SsuD/methylene tetrahydromethanopterin reductase-like flavin-dependent oxidoreductase (luciferase family)
VLVGGTGPKVLDRVLRYGDGWIPNDKDLDRVAARIVELRERAGRHVHVTYYGATPENVDHVREMGVDRALFTIESGTREQVLAQLAAAIPSLA